jgi:hypothetical protein
LATPRGKAYPPTRYHQQKSAQYIDYKGPSGNASRKRVRKLLILMAIEVKYNKQRGLQFFELELPFIQWDTTQNHYGVTVTLTVLDLTIAALSGSAV